jgi:hypothetical protein
MEVSNLGHSDHRSPCRRRHWFRLWTIHGQRKMGTITVVITYICRAQTHAMGCVEDHHVLWELPTYTAYEAFNVRRLPRTLGSAHDLINAYVMDALPNGRAVDTITIMEEIARGLIAWEGLDHLLSGPLGSGTLRHVEMHHAAPFMRQDHQRKQYPVWTLGTTKNSRETKSLTWFFRETCHVGEGGFIGYHRQPHHDQVTGTGKASQPRMLAKGENVKDWYRIEFSGRTGELVPCSMRRSVHGPWQRSYPCQGAGVPRCPPGKLRPLKLLSEKGYV